MFELTPGIGLSTTALQKYKLKTQENCCLQPLQARKAISLDQLLFILKISFTFLQNKIPQYGRQLYIPLPFCQVSLYQHISNKPVNLPMPAVSLFYGRISNCFYHYKKETMTGQEGQSLSTSHCQCFRIEFDTDSTRNNKKIKKNSHFTQQLLF